MYSKICIDKFLEFFAMKTVIKLGTFLSFMLLTACKPSVETSTPNASLGEQIDTTNNTVHQDNKALAEDINADGKIHLDLSKLDTGVARADLTNYVYPFEIDGSPVQNYAKAYGISAKDAQLAMTLSMASPEALNKVLDMMVGEYLGHSLTDGKAMSLVIYTTDKVVPVSFEYVIADKFGEGLVLPVTVMPASRANERPEVDTKALFDRVHGAESGNHHSSQGN